MNIHTNGSTSDAVLNKLRSDLQNGQVAVFIGAGISAALAQDSKIDGFNLASWGGLIQHGAKWARDWCGYDEKFANSVALDITGDTSTMLAAAEKVSEELKRNR